MNTLTVKAPKISCGHCVNTVQTEVADLAGVAQVVADAQTKLVTVTYDAPASEAQIKELLSEIGYPAEAV